MAETLSSLPPIRNNSVAIVDARIILKEEAREGFEKFDRLQECTESHHISRNGRNMWKEGDLVKKCIACHSPGE